MSGPGEFPVLSQILSSLSSSLFSCLAFLSCLVFSCLVLSCLSFSFSFCFCLRVVLCGRGVVVVVVLLVVVVRGVCLVCVFVFVCCGTVKKREKKKPCVRSKRPRVYWHQAHMYETCGLTAGTHGNVLNGHTEARSMHTPVPLPPTHTSPSKPKQSNQPHCQTMKPDQQPPTTTTQIQPTHTHQQQQQHISDSNHNNQRTKPKKAKTKKI